ncbi:N-terminal C2 in EEIG1 and EHBP1 proteins-domain-containing protein [Mycena maculata]|uniref:N-terminal C2 in EEIG1 and EHBP1 proteins-domain-containing protein n=1 Tax=Mycena maculata TaxID=230809 RepID=A0AAD7JL62_9AGAR|nr:N-terminal C2 in EEIG1 and EHBP1 proteins-domain-containing protein [Mycena maculata]
MSTLNTDDVAPSPASTPTGKLRAQLNNLLLPRHALFSVHVTIHQLANVPLLNGEFGVRWRFKNTKKAKGKERAKSEHEDGDRDSFGSGDSTEEPQTLGVPSHSKFASAASESSVFIADYAEESTSARGQTPWVPLRNHSVVWEQPLSAVVQMSIDRETHQLLPHPFKLTVQQRVIAHDPDAPQNPRLGVVELDLAQYADSFPAPGASKGVVTRRYLLRDSKTNATLRLSVRVEPAGAPPPFAAPPLPAGEILAGVATLLSTHSDVYRTRPRALDLYAPVDDDAPSRRTFAAHTLPRAYGPRPTESLIDAIFNPAPVRDERLVGPFTRLVPSASASVASLGSASFGMATDSSETASFGMTESSSAASLRSVPAKSALVPSPSAPAGLSPESAEGRSHRWWMPIRDRSRSRSRAGTRVAVA